MNQEREKSKNTSPAKAGEVFNLGNNLHITTVFNGKTG
jgi:hypothetical protein